MNKRKKFQIDVTHQDMEAYKRGAMARGFSAVAVWIKHLVWKDIKATDKEQRKSGRDEGV